MPTFNKIFIFRCITIQYTAPTDYIFFKPHLLKPFALKILEVLSDLDLEESPILFHVFSNGGGFVYRYLSEVISPQSQWKVVGAIFDSLPSDRRPLIAARAAMSSSQANVLIKYLTGLFVLTYIYGAELLQRLWRDSSRRNYWDFMLNEPPKWPSLYLYSKADEIADYNYIEEVIANRQLLGADVASVCWEDSDHVAHMRRHPDAYISQCDKFLDYCVQKAQLKGSKEQLQQAPFGQTAV